MLAKHVKVIPRDLYSVMIIDFMLIYVKLNTIFLNEISLLIQRSSNSTYVS